MKLRCCLLFCIALLIVSPAFSQSNGQPTDPKEIVKAIVYHDSIFWEAYNVCDVEKMASLFTDDLEFYHDKSGLTATLDKFKESVHTGMCGDGGWRLRREAITGTVKVFPLNNYGGLITGEHIFYINDGKKETRDGYGKFTQVWKFENNKWKMSRVFSYDHGPAPYINKRQEIPVPEAFLKKLSGRYTSSQAGIVTITPGKNTLNISSNNLNFVVYPESTSKFFLKERDIQFEFVMEKKKVVKILVYEKGSKVDEMSSNK